MSNNYISIHQYHDCNHKFYNINGTQEISVSLFGQCNMKCDFCITHQRQSSFNIQKANNIEHTLLNIICTNPKRKFQICLYGGEIFHDGISDDVVNWIDQLIQKLKLVANRCGKQVIFNIGTNCIHTKRNRVLSLLKKNNISFLYTSFDFVGRFKTTHQLQLFKENVYWYKSQGINVNISFIAGYNNINFLYTKNINDPIYSLFNQLYNDFNILFDYCYPTNSVTAVTEQDLGKFVIWLYDNYPKIVTLQNIISGDNVCDCPAIFVTDDDVTYQCCNFVQNSQTYAINKQCDECKFNLKCNKHCVRLFYNQTDCFVKALLNYINRDNI